MKKLCNNANDLVSKRCECCSTTLPKYTHATNGEAVIGFMSISWKVIYMAHRRPLVCMTCTIFGLHQSGLKCVVYANSERKEIVLEKMGRLFRVSTYVDSMTRSSAQGVHRCGFTH